MGGHYSPRGDNLHLVIIVWVGVLVGETSHYHNGIVYEEEMYRYEEITFRNLWQDSQGVVQLMIVHTEHTLCSHKKILNMHLRWKNLNSCETKSEMVSRSTACPCKDVHFFDSMTESSSEKDEEKIFRNFSSAFLKEGSSNSVLNLGEIMWFLLTICLYMCFRYNSRIILLRLSVHAAAGWLAGCKIWR